MDGRPLEQGELVAPVDPSSPSNGEPEVLRRGGSKGRWLRRFIGISLTLAIFAWIFKPVVLHWPEVRDRIHQTNVFPVLIASLMFSAFLFIFRAMSWRRILIGFGHRLPVAPTVRIWSSSELSRYLPGVIWQVVSRIYL